LIAHNAQVHEIGRVVSLVELDHGSFGFWHSQDVAGSKSELINWSSHVRHRKPEVSMMPMVTEVSSLELMMNVLNRLWLEVHWECGLQEII